MNSEFPQPSLKKINKNFEQNHKNLFENIKRVYHPNQAAKEFEIVRSFSKRNLNIKANQNLNKQELQRSPNIKSPNRSKEKNLQQFSLLFTPSPVKFKNQSCFRKELTTYHNNFAENLNHNLLIPNSYSKLFLEKEISYRNCSNIAKNRSEANLLNKSQAMAKDFCYHDDNNYLSNTNLTEIDEINHKRPNETQIGRLRCAESPKEKSINSDTKEKEIKFEGGSNEEVFNLKNELDQSKTLIGILKMEILNMNKENEQMKLKILEISTQQKEMMGIIVNKHQSFIEKLISDKNQLSLKCEEYLYELKQNQPKDYSFQTEMETLKKLSSNEETQSAYMKINKDFIHLQNERNLFNEQTNINKSQLQNIPPKTYLGESQRFPSENLKEENRNFFNFNPVPVYNTNRKI